MRGVAGVDLQRCVGVSRERGVDVVDAIVEHVEQFEQFGADLRMCPQQVDARPGDGVSRGDHLVGQRRDEHVERAGARVRRRCRRSAVSRPVRGVADRSSMRSLSSMWRRRPTARRRRTASCGPAGSDGRAGVLAEVGPAAVAVVDVVEVEPGLVEEVGERRCRVARVRSDRSSSTLAGHRVGIASRRLRSTMSVATASSSMWQPAGRNGNCDAGRRARRRVGSRRAGLGSGGRTGTPCGGCRRSRAPCRTACSVVLRRPRPSCWRNSVGLSVGRSIRIVSTSGTSTPSLNRSTEKTTRTRPAARSRSAPSRSACAGFARDRHRVDAVAVEVLGHEVGVLDADAEPERASSRRCRRGLTTCWTTSRAHASELV